MTSDSEFTSPQEIQRWATSRMTILMTKVMASFGEFMLSLQTKYPPDGIPRGDIEAWYSSILALVEGEITVMRTEGKARMPLEAHDALDKTLLGFVSGLEEKTKELKNKLSGDSAS